MDIVISICIHTGTFTFSLSSTHRQCTDCTYANMQLLCLRLQSSYLRLEGMWGSYLQRVQNWQWRKCKLREQQNNILIVFSIFTVLFFFNTNHHHHLHSARSYSYGATLYRLSLNEFHKKTKSKTTKISQTWQLLLVQAWKKVQLEIDYIVRTVPSWNE